MAQDHTFRVRHAVTGRVAVESESYGHAAAIQYANNVEQAGADWQLWLVDADGFSVLVQTQI